MRSGEIKDEQTPAQLIQAKFEVLGDWRGKMLSRIRSLVREAALMSLKS